MKRLVVVTLVPALLVGCTGSQSSSSSSSSSSSGGASSVAGMSSSAAASSVGSSQGGGSTSAAASGSSTAQVSSAAGSSSVMAGSSSVAGSSVGGSSAGSGGASGSSGSSSSGGLPGTVFLWDTTPPGFAGGESMYAVSDDSVYLVGNAGGAMHCTTAGGCTTLQTGSVADFKLVWGTSDTDLWIIARETSATVSLHYNGSMWTRVAFPTACVPDAIHGSGSMVLVACNQQVYRYISASSSWEWQSANSQFLYATAIHAVSISQVYLGNSTLKRWDGANTAMDIPGLPATSLRGIQHDGQKVWVATSNANNAVFTFDSSVGWMNTQFSTVGAVDGFALRTPTDAWVTMHMGTSVQHFNGISWSAVPLATFWTYYATGTPNVVWISLRETGATGRAGVMRLTPR